VKKDILTMVLSTSGGCHRCHFRHGQHTEEHPYGDDEEHPHSSGHTAVGKSDITGTNGNSQFLRYVRWQEATNIKATTQALPSKRLNPQMETKRKLRYGL